jgi:hypothetical protein
VPSAEDAKPRGGPKLTTVRELVATTDRSGFLHVFELFTIALRWLFATLRGLALDVVDRTAIDRCCAYPNAWASLLRWSRAVDCGWMNVRRVGRFSSGLGPPVRVRVTTLPWSRGSGFQAPLPDDPRPLEPRHVLCLVAWQSHLGPPAES